jgi:hypothetical protein
VTSIQVSRSTTSPCIVSATTNPRLRKNGNLRHGNSRKAQAARNPNPMTYRKNSRIHSCLIPIVSSSPHSVRRMQDQVRRSVVISYLQRAGNLLKRSFPSPLATGMCSLNSIQPWHQAQHRADTLMSYKVPPLPLNSSSR